MSKYNKYKGNTPAFAGLILLIVGAVWLLGAVGIVLPKIIFHPGIILIAIGLYFGAKVKYKESFGWVIPTFIGGALILKDAFDINIWKLGAPVALIAIGGYIIYNANRNKYIGTSKNNNSNNNDFIPYTEYTNPFADKPPVSSSVQEDVTNADTEPKQETSTNNTASNFTMDAASNDTNTTNTGNTYNADREEELVNATAIFSGVRKTINSKQFLGGDIVSVFGGVEINFLNCDMKAPVVLDVTTFMGGVKLIVPQNWIVKNEVSVLFGGVEDRRPIMQVNDDSQRVLILKGIAIMGGIDLRSF